MEVQFDGAPLPDPKEYKAIARATLRPLKRGSEPKTLASILPLGSTPLSNYDRNYLPLTHPGVYPNGSGGRPQNMSFIAHASGDSQMYPAEQFGNNAGHTISALNAHQLHEVNVHTKLTLSRSPQTCRVLEKLTVVEVLAAFNASRVTGSRLLKAKEGMSAGELTSEALLPCTSTNLNLT